MKIRGILLASAAAGVALAPGAQAADMPLKSQVAAPIAPPSWAGFYIGLHAGGAAVRNGAFEDNDYNSGTAFIGGGQIGYNWQVGSLVLGLEADGSWLSRQKYQTDDFSGIGYGSQIPWLATARGRFGAAVGNWHLYATAGAAFTKIKLKDCCDPGGFTLSKSRVGFAVGGGAEYMLTRNWIIGAEILYVDFGTTQHRYPNGGSKNTLNSAVIGRAKLNYKF